MVICWYWAQLQWAHRIDFGNKVLVQLYWSSSVMRGLCSWWKECATWALLDSISTSIVVSWRVQCMAFERCWNLDAYLCLDVSRIFFNTNLSFAKISALSCSRQDTSVLLIDGSVRWIYYILVHLNFHKVSRLRLPTPPNYDRILPVGLTGLAQPSTLRTPSNSILSQVLDMDKTSTQQDQTTRTITILLALDHLRT